MKRFFVLPVLLYSGISFSQICPPQYMNEVVEPMFQASETAHDAAVEAMDQSLSTILQLGTEQVTSAIAVLTKQKAVTGSQVADAARVTNQQVATGLQALEQSKRIKEARVKFGAEFGQGYNPCLVHASRTAIAARADDMRQERTGRVATEVRGGAGKYAPPTKALKDASDENKKFCTDDHVKSGLCERAGNLKGASMNAATLFESASEGDEVYEAKVAFVNNVIGLPDGEIPPSVGKTPQGAEYMSAKARKDARLSVASTILKDIQLEHSAVSGAHTGQDLPLAEHFDNEVKRYSGDSAEYLNWSASLTAQDERGLLVEILKVKSLDVAIQHRQYEQYELMEAGLAALLAVEADRLQAKASREAQSATINKAKAQLQ